jgi:hypothetical protein
MSVLRSHFHGRGGVLRETPERSNRAIGASLRVDYKTVGSERERLESFGQISLLDTRTVERNGQTYTQQTTNIGRRPALRHVQEPDDDFRRTTYSRSQVP